MCVCRGIGVFWGLRVWGSGLSTVQGFQVQVKGSEC